MACTRGYILVATALLSLKVAFSLPAESAREATPSFGAQERHRLDKRESLFGVEQSVDPELYSVLKCRNCTEKKCFPLRRPDKNTVDIYSTSILEDARRIFYCNATLESHKRVDVELRSGKVMTPNFPASGKYENHHLEVYYFECEPNQVLFIDTVCIGLQNKIPFWGLEYCVDFVKIRPKIVGHPDVYCENETFSDGPHRIDGGNVTITFRTSQKDNDHSGFMIELYCEDRNTKENLLLQYLQQSSLSDMEHRWTDHEDATSYDSLTKLVNFSSRPCGSAPVSSNWDIVELAIRNENARELKMRTAARQVLQCFPPSEIAYARIAMGGA